ncbi:MAG: YitT family protein [Clostridium sp.]|uniref:YczE/YyaS/YitT family protein n=1 Tax=Clostridium sp. TaxID=1506 RepID=UPI002914775B|nr:YitT family protein [Clostridium sp.]MDU5110689.1 YitT family protein [Clostridium sp.]
MNLSSFKNRIILFVVGIMILTLGVALTVKADLGVGTWDSVNVGLSNRFGLSVGTFSFIIAIIMTIIAAILRNGKFNLYTLGTALVLSSFTDFWLFVVNKLPLGDSYISRVVYFLLGILILSMGLAIYLTPNLAPNSLDDCMMAFRNKFNLSVGMAKLVTDGVGIIFAILVGGPIGIGTIVIILSVAPLVNIFFNRINSAIIVSN